MRILLLLSIACTAAPRAKGDWLTLPSTYTHDVATGQRVNQFAPIAAPTAPQATNFRSSGYTQTRSTINYGQSSDNYHRVEKWGDPVRPYGEWRFPYRPYSTPYPNWGPPFGGISGAFGGGFRPGLGPGFGPGYGPGFSAGDRPGFGTGDGPGIDRPDRRRPLVGPQLNPNPDPYPAGPRSPYPVAPYYDGFYPNYRD